MAYLHPGELYLARFGSVTDVGGVLRYTQFLRDEAGLSATPPIDLARIYTRFGMPTPQRAFLPNDMQGLLVNPGMGLILVNESDSPGRQRFTEGHELMEQLFTAMSMGKGWAAQRYGGLFKASTKEQLCNLGAAELLMPQASFLSLLLAQGVRYQTACYLAAEYQVSVTAALVQMARLAPGRHAVVVWRMKSKPAEMRNLRPPNQLALFEDVLPESPPPKLRVEWAISGPGTAYIPPNKSVSAESSIHRAWQEGEFRAGWDVEDLGAGSRTFFSENYPFDLDGERNILSLLHMPGDTGCGWITKTQ